MILVDSSVWIEYVRGGQHPACELFESLLDEGRELCLTGVVLTEVLQGIRGPAQFRKVHRYLADFPSIQPTEGDHVLAAELYRGARRQGITVRSTIDCILAAICLERDIPVFHLDKDFEQLARVFELRTIPIRST